MPCFADHLSSLVSLRVSEGFTSCTQRNRVEFQSVQPCKRILRSCAFLLAWSECGHVMAVLPQLIHVLGGTLPPNLTTSYHLNCSPQSFRQEPRVTSATKTRSDRTQKEQAVS